MVSIHFLNVGKGNCVIIEHPSGKITLVDIDNSRLNNYERKLTDPIEYLKYFNVDSIFRFILTHPDMDHMSGLNDLSENIEIINFWDTQNNKKIEESSWEQSPYERRDWEKYQSFKNNETGPKYLQKYRGDEGEFWTDDSITILSPSKNLVKMANDTEEYNHLSYVLMVDLFGVKILLGGDASSEAWEEILERCGKSSLKADILFAPHHGSKNNLFKPALEAVSPEYVIVSVAEGVDYAYDYYSNLAEVQVFSTKHFKNIILNVFNNGNYDLFYQE